MIKIPLIMTGCTRQTGKDTLCARFSEINPKIRRFAFADALKDDLIPFIEKNFGFYLPTCPIEEKELIRPIMIAYGLAQRSRDPEYWVKRLLRNIEACLAANPEIIPVITDARFPNEIKYIKQHYPGSIYIQVNRTGAPEPTDEEKKHLAWMAIQADYTLDWGNNSVEAQQDIARKLLERIL